MRERLDPLEVIAIQLQKPMKPKIYNINKNQIHFECPNCHYDRYYQRGRIRFPNNCEDCGQKFNWEDVKKSGNF